MIEHLKNADSGRVISTRGRFHQNLLECLIAAAKLQSFQAEFKQAVDSYFKGRIKYSSVL